MDQYGRLKQNLWVKSKTEPRENSRNLQKKIREIHYKLFKYTVLPRR